MGTVVAIHQPNFLPWLGYFSKIARADRFVFLDAVEYSKGSWINRVKILSDVGPLWLTCPVQKGSGSRAIKDVIIAKTPNWNVKMLKTIRQYYSSAPHFDEMYTMVKGLLDEPGERLADFNIRCIRTICSKIGLDKEFIRQSTLHEPDAFTASGSKRLAAICNELGATQYLAGNGSQEYEDESTYSRNQLTLSFNPFMNKAYPQCAGKSFTGGLSIIDALFNLGSSATLSLLTEDR